MRKPQDQSRLVAKPAAADKQPSKRIASIASRIASGGDFSTDEARQVAASLLAQMPAKQEPKRYHYSA